MTTVAHAGPALDALKAAWQAERHAAITAGRAADRTTEWHHLERAHILSQPLAGLHLRTRVLRLVLAVPGSISGRYPVGNTGGADVSAFTPMAVPEDLRPLLLALGGAA